MICFFITVRHSYISPHFHYFTARGDGEQFVISLCLYYHFTFTIEISAPNDALTLKLK
jgi:hypothetical protein